MHWKVQNIVNLLIAGAGVGGILMGMPGNQLILNVYHNTAPVIACITEIAAREATQNVLKETEGVLSFAASKIIEIVSLELPVYSYSVSEYESGVMSENYQDYVTLMLSQAEENEEPEEKNSQIIEHDTERSDKGETAASDLPIESDLENFVITEGEDIKRNGAANLFISRQKTIDLQEYQQPEEVIKNFYTIDSTTTADLNLFQIGTLSEMNMKLDSSKTQGPQILIYHTHASETYAGIENAGDTQTGAVHEGQQAGVVEAGECLAEILRQQYGYDVLHHTEVYDAGARDYAYSYALPAIEKLLRENPSIQVVIDLHRDAVSEDTKLMTPIGGVETAQFMFFNGLSNINEIGQIAYLPNEHLQENLAFSFQMQKKCDEYYPGLTRKIYLKGYRYNLHLMGKSLLVELGAQTNTLEEAENACWPLARVLHMVLSGTQE